MFFDLPSATAKERRTYAVFRKYLIKSGFLMMQESVYSRLVLTNSAAQNVIANLKKNKPSHGLVQILTITEKQFSKMETIVGERRSEVIDSDERLIIL